MPVKVAVCQVPDIQENVNASLAWMEEFIKIASAENVSLICFPECFLQGYLTQNPKAGSAAINLQSVHFKKICQQLATYAPMVVTGLIEEEEGLLFNTAIVIKDGLLIGKYRKTHLLDGENIFTPGNEYPLFEINGLRFGINICYDTQFPAVSIQMKEQGAALILCLSNTMMSEKKAIKFKQQHFSVRAQRAKENNIWMLSSDITGEREGRIAYGSTSVINPAGEITKQVPFMETGMLFAEV